MPHFKHTAKLYSCYFLFILCTSLGSWYPSHRRSETAYGKGETSQLLKRHLQNEHQEGGKTSQATNVQRNIYEKQTKISRNPLVWGQLA